MTESDHILRPWPEIARELFSESNTERMLILLNELTEAFKQQRTTEHRDQSTKS
jgi:hypothetical protein